MNINGQPTKYKPEYAKQVYKLCLLGAKNSEIADFFGISYPTVQAWRNKYEAFDEAVRKGKEEADMSIASCLYKSAKGYTYTDKKYVMRDGVKTLVEINEKTMAPNVTSLIFWLSNRCPDLWQRNKLPTAESEALHNSVINLVLKPGKDKDGEDDNETNQSGRAEAG